MLSSRFERKNPKDYSQIVDRTAARFLPLAGAAVAAQAKELAPVKTGNLKGSISYRTENGAAIVGTNVDYAQHIEYGTRNLPRMTLGGHTGYRPFLRPAIDVLRKKLVQMFGRMVREEVARRG